MSHRCFDRVVVLGGNENAGLGKRGRGAAADTFGKTTGAAGRTSRTSLQGVAVGGAKVGGGAHAGGSSRSSGSGSSSSSSRTAPRNTSNNVIAGEGSKDAAAPIGVRFTPGAGTAHRDDIDPSAPSVENVRPGGCMDEEKTGLLQAVDIGEVHEGTEGVRFHEERKQNKWNGNICADERGVVVLGNAGGGGGGIESGDTASDRNGNGDENYDDVEGPVEEEERKEGSVEARVSGQYDVSLFVGSIFVSGRLARFPCFYFVFAVTSVLTCSFSMVFFCLCCGILFYLKFVPFNC